MWRDRLLREESWAVVKCIRHNNVVVFISKLTQDLKRLNVSIFRCHSSCLHSLNNLHESVSNIMTSNTCIKFPPVGQLVTFLSVYLGTSYLDFIQNIRWCMWRSLPNLQQEFQSRKKKLQFFSLNLLSIPKDIPWHYWNKTKYFRLRRYDAIWFLSY